MRTPRVFALLLPLAFALGGVGCAGGNMTADSAVVLLPGSSAVVSTSGESVTVRLARDGEASETAVIVLSGPASSGKAGAWKASNSASLPAGSWVVQELRQEAHQIVVVNNGNTTASVSIHVEGADGFKVVQQSPAASTLTPGQ